MKQYIEKIKSSLFNCKWMMTGKWWNQQHQDTLNNQTNSGFYHQTRKAFSPTPRKHVYSR